MTNLYRRSGANEAPCSDPIPLCYNVEYHVFHLSSSFDSLGQMAPYRCTCTQRHIVSKDMIHWTIKEPTIAPGELGSADENGCWTGSCILKDLQTSDRTFELP